MPVLKNKTFNINIDGQIIELSGESISFFLKETRRKFATKKSLEKFYENLSKIFTQG
jgi:hypothetical protein